VNETDARTRKPLSLTPKHLVGRMFIGGTKMRWDGPADPRLDGVCPWSWLGPVPDTAVTK
jgi:hypothetical protein